VPPDLAVIRGGGDLGSGVALRLWRCGFHVAILEVESPVAVRRTVSFSEAVYDGVAVVEEATGRLIQDAAGAVKVMAAGEIAVLVDPPAASVKRLVPYALVDAILAKRNTGTRKDMAPCTVALGPGFEAGIDVCAVVETNRGPNLGRVIWHGSPEADTGVPAPIGDRAADRVLRAPGPGTLENERTIGDVVQQDDIVARVGNVPVRAPFAGMVRGLARAGLTVQTGMKIGDLDPRMDPSLCGLVSDKSLAVAGGVLEAVLATKSKRHR
jgi:xanthine dehydrogenase accessory factor